MNAFVTAPEYPPAVPATAQETAPAAKGPGLRVNGYAAIFTVAIVLALATASECHSITYPPSLIYGAAFWLWWACVASAMWMIGRRLPFVSSFSLMGVLVHLSIGSALGIVHLLLLGSLGFTDAAWRLHATAFEVWTGGLSINRLGIEILLYGFVFGITGVIQFRIRVQRDALK